MRYYKREKETAEASGCGALRGENEIKAVDEKVKDNRKWEQKEERQVSHAHSYLDVHLEETISPRTCPCEIMVISNLIGC